MPAAKPARRKPVNSRAKGARGELQLAKALTDAGHPAERGQQRKGGADSPDVICPSLAAFHIECKLTAACKMHSPAQLATWDEQAKRDAGQLRIPLVVHRWNGCTTWWVRVLKRGLSPYWQTLPDFLADVEYGRGL